MRPSSTRGNASGKEISDSPNSAQSTAYWRFMPISAGPQKAYGNLSRRACRPALKCGRQGEYECTHRKPGELVERRGSGTGWSQAGTRPSVAVPPLQPTGCVVQDTRLDHEPVAYRAPQDRAPPSAPRIERTVEAAGPRSVRATPGRGGLLGHAMHAVDGSERAVAQLHDPVDQRGDAGRPRRHQARSSAAVARGALSSSSSTRSVSCSAMARARAA